MANMLQGVDAKNAIGSRENILFLSCGRSKQPFCDGSYKRLQTGITPIKFVAEKKRIICVYVNNPKSSVL